MFHFWDNYLQFLYGMNWSHFLHWGWFIFIIDVPRFLLLIAIVLFWSRNKRKRTRGLWEKAKKALFDENPFITVLVPGHNEGRHLGKLVNCMKSQSYQNFELIVVDDGSTDNTPFIGRSFERKGDIDLFIRAEERGGKASAANLGLRYSKGRYIVHLDADSSLDDDAIEKVLIPFYRYKNVGAVGGNLIVRNENDSLTTTMQFLEYIQSISVARIVLSALGICKIVSGAFGAFPKKVLDRIGGWDVGPGLDGDLTVKIRKLNMKIIFEEEAVCKTHVPVTWKALSRQRLRWSRSLVRFRIRKHKDVLLPDHHFKWSNFITSFENIFFSFVMDFLWIFYTIKIILVAPEFLWVWIPFKFTLYFLIALARHLLAFQLKYDKVNLLKKIIYLPLYPLYMGYFMRIVRTIAYVDEFFFYGSYKDKWNPWKVSRKARVFNM